MMVTTDSRFVTRTCTADVGRSTPERRKESPEQEEQETEERLLGVLPVWEAPAQ